MNTRAPRRQLFVIALLAATTLVYEIALTRVLSVVFWYHWAFLCISLAMLGLGASGIWLTVLGRSARLLSACLLTAALTLPLSVWVIVKFGASLGSWGIVVAMGAMLLPFLSIGATICLLLMEAPTARVSRLYTFDLLGACLGAVLVIPLLTVAPTPLMVASLGLVPIAAHMVLRGRVTPAAASVLAVVLGVLVWREPFQVRRSKAYEETGFHAPIYEKWTPTARLTFFDHLLYNIDPAAGFAWGRNRQFERTGVRQYRIEQDGSAGIPITEFSGDWSRLGFLLDDVTTVGYQVRTPEKVAIIGAGGGRDVLTALLSKATNVDAVELNASTVEAVSGRFKELSGDVYHLPGVRAIVGEGRSFLTRTPRRDYDLIQISLIDSWAATAAGAFALSENSLYTVEAFSLYLSRLSNHGMVSISRWIVGPFGIEMPRAVLLAEAALQGSGVADPLRHLIVLRGGRVGTVLVSKQPFTAADLARLAEICQERSFTQVFPTPPGEGGTSVVADVLTRGTSEFTAKGIDLDPPTDDKPFFFQVLSPFRRLDSAVVAEYGINGEAVWALQMLILATSGVVLALFFTPFVVFRSATRPTDLFTGTSFFAAIGIGFMLVEIPWLQRFALYLGHPSYAATVVLAALLLGSGCGSLAAARVGIPGLRRIGLVLPVLLVALRVLLPDVLTSTLGLGLALRILIAFLILVPVGVLMGLWFPIGLAHFGERGRAWYWAVNGAAGVLASVLALALSIQFGFAVVGLAGAAFYLAAWAITAMSTRG